MHASSSVANDSADQTSFVAANWALFLFLVGLWTIDFCIFPLLLQLMATGLLPPLLVSGFLFGLVTGQACWLAVVGGLLGRCWLAGIMLASALTGVSLACVLAGQSWQYYFSLYDFSQLTWGLFAIPALVLAGSVPLLATRVVLSWQLTRTAANAGRQGSVGLEELFVTTAAIAAMLFMCRVPLVAWEVVAQEFFVPLLAIPTMLGAFNLFLTLPAVYLMFQLSLGRRRWLAFSTLILADLCLMYAVLEAFYVLTGSPTTSATEPFVLSASVGGTASLILLVGLKLLRASGFRLDVPTAQTAALSDTEQFEAARGGRRLHRSWAAMVFAVAVAASFSLARLDGWRRAADERNLAIYRELEADGGALNVRDRRVVELELPPDATDSELAQYAFLKHVESISLANSQVTWVGLSRLQEFPKLRALDLSNVAIDEKELAELQRLKNLQHLSLEGTDLAASELFDLLDQLNLTSLDVGHLGLNDDFLMKLPTVRTVPASLILTGNNITDAGLRAFFAVYGNAFFLLDLSGTGIDGSGLAGTVALQELVLDDVPLTDATFGPVLASLQVNHLLVLRNTGLTDSVLPRFAKTTAIRGLELGDGHFTDQGLSTCGLFAFDRLKLTGIQFTGSCFKDWHPNIYELSLSGSSFSDANVRYLANLPNLQVLDLSNTGITDACLPAIANSEIYDLNLSYTRVTARGLRSAAADLVDFSQINIALGQFTLEEVRDLKKVLPIVIGSPHE